MTKEATIRLNKAELWELICNFGASYESDIPENALADQVAAKLQAAYETLK